MKIVSRLLFVPAILVCCILGFPGTVFPQGETGRFDNEHWSREGEALVITYDLMGSLEETYDVSVVLRREKEKNFSFAPTAVRGNVGKDQKAGARKQIRWDYKKDFPSGLPGDDYWFELTAAKMEKGGAIQWWHYAAAGAGAAVAAVIFVGGKGGTSPEQPNTLPYPPTVRP